MTTCTQEFTAALLLTLFTGGVMAQASPAANAGPVTASPVGTADNAPAPNPERVGDATAQLLSLQRNAGGPNRPISGEQAGLSYQRYLDSFKRPIPESLDSMVRGQSKSP